jgi:2-polyprenyl-3-methyl-5-hydroxy-6-metoxy-1,4-benzoquinol methylase
MEHIMSQSVSISQRYRVPEIMDMPDLDAHRHAHALRGIARINRWSGSARILWAPISALACEISARPLRILDIATGGGDVPIRLWHKARRAGVPAVIDGCDLSRCAVAFAQHRAKERGADISFFQLNALTDELPPDYDVVMCSLFLHHLDDEQAVELLRRMSQAARRMVLINDLRRSRAGLALAKLATRLLTTSKVVHFDGPQSVRAAFAIDEVDALANRAGLKGATIEKRWPCRFLLTWRR